MDRELYKERLRAFNATPKYKAELDFLLKLVAPIKGNKVLDYGCGLGTAVHYFNANMLISHCFGYDVRNYRDQDDEFLFRQSFSFKFDKVFFLHSIAHIPDIYDKLEELKTLLNPGAKIYVITPNKIWLDAVTTPGYVPDPTVIKHFDLNDLRTLFSSAKYNVINSGQFGTLNNWVNERIFLEAQYE